MQRPRERRVSSENYDRKYQLRTYGYDFEKVVCRVSQLLGINPKHVVTSGKRRHEVEARDLVCYWSSKELGISQVVLAGKIGVSQPAISTALHRGEKIVNERQLSLYVMIHKLKVQSEIVHSK